ncbi:unnamed protein product [Linum tenue]|uniref:Stomagen C-terminal domain-containing protein n=1 Tax=Linum tenue TaxID=586396 RepID=A0AAV0RVC4_9ROSI|nr:unnamed protein product [Linum tenue]
MAASNTKPYHSLFLLFFFFFTCAVLAAAAYAAPQGPRSHNHHHHHQLLIQSSQNATPQDMLRTPQEGKKGRSRGRKGGRRLMIGSTAPICTYNECRGCKTRRCRAEQVPVEGNDPINSAYHYKCVCHR